jgi:hypothetical protein
VFESRNFHLVPVSAGRLWDRLHFNTLLPAVYPSDPPLRGIDEVLVNTSSQTGVASKVLRILAGPG